MTRDKRRDPPGVALLRLVARTLPLGERDDWLAEWIAEATHAWEADPSSAGAMRLRLRCLGALRDARWMRRYRSDSGGSSLMLSADLRFAVRSLSRSAAFTTIVVATLACCIGATTSVFSIVESVLLHGLRYRQIDRLVAVWSDNPRENNHRYQVSVGDYYDWRQRSRSFSRLAGFFPIWNAWYSAPDGVERLDVGAVTANLLPTLGVTPMLGRGFLEGEDKRGATPTVILSHAFWERDFQGDPRVVGKTVTLDNQAYTVIGVMDEHFAFPQSRVDVLMPISVLGSYLDRREVHMLSVIGRLREGVTLEAARREMTPIAAQLRREHPAEDAALGVTVDALTDDLLGDVRRPILVLFGAVCAVLLVGCANVTNLLFARAWSRRQELAVRTAMGAPSRAIVQQLLVESGVIAVAASVLGIAIAVGATRVLTTMLPVSISRIGTVAIDGRVLGFTVLVGVLVTLLCGTAPAFGAARTTTRGTLDDAARGSHGRATRRMYRGLVVGELALALILAVSAGLLINSFARLSGTDPGFRRDHLLRIKLSLPAERFPRGSGRAAFYESLLNRVRAIPGVRGAGIITRFPLVDGNVTTAVTVEGAPPPADSKPPAADLRQAGRGYFGAMGTAFVAGRDFATTDADSGVAPVVIINETAARTILGSANPVGRRIDFSRGKGPFVTIVGVVKDVHDASLREPPHAQVFLSAEQSPPSVASLAVAYSGDVGPVIASVRQIARSIDRTVPLFGIMTVETVLDNANLGDRFTTVLLASFSTLALFLAALGTYGVMAFGVTERTREIGVRIALGARSYDVLTMVLREGLVLLVIALPIALVGLWATTGVLRTLLFGIEPTDPRTIVAAVATLSAATLVACYVPARRAARVDPVAAIRGSEVL